MPETPTVIEGVSSDHIIEQCIRLLRLAECLGRRKRVIENIPTTRSIYDIGNSNLVAMAINFQFEKDR